MGLVDNNILLKKNIYVLFLYMVDQRLLVLKLISVADPIDDRAEPDNNHINEHL